MERLVFSMGNLNVVLMEGVSCGSRLKDGFAGSCVFLFC